MEKGIQKIVWSKQAGRALFQIFKYVANESYEAAVKIIDSIEKQVNLLPGNPGFFPPDKQKKNNNGTYRSFTKYKYRVAYRVSKNSIKTVRIRHGGMKPLIY